VATLNRAISIHYYTNTLYSMKNPHMKYDYVVSKWPVVIGNEAEKLKFDLHGGQFPASGGS